MQREPNTEYILSLSYGKDSLACLEAIKQLGYPLDRIVHAEVWATDTIPADLPPMIDFKAHADKIIKEKYGYTVEHICAVRGVRNLPTKDGSTSGLTQDEIKAESMASLTPSERGVIADLKLMPCQELEKVTYEKLFYRIPKRRKKAMTGGEKLVMDSQSQKEIGVPVTSNNKHCDNVKKELQVSGFPGLAIMGRAAWCTGELKKKPLNFLPAPLHKGRRKILCSTSELLLMSQNELRDIPFRVKCYHS